MNCPVEKKDKESIFDFFKKTCVSIEKKNGSEINFISILIFLKYTWVRAEAIEQSRGDSPAMSLYSLFFEVSW
jgi:hypothetical protein